MREESLPVNAEEVAVVSTLLEILAKRMVLETLQRIIEDAFQPFLRF